jgi:anti-sigma factor RsiW
MTERLDRLIDQLAASPTDRSLAHFDARVARGVAEWRVQARARAALVPLRLAAIGAALAAGLAAGGVTASAMIPGPASAFSVSADLAPSTLLDGR